jgi:hypothetical protein
MRSVKGPRRFAMKKYNFGRDEVAPHDDEIISSTQSAIGYRQSRCQIERPCASSADLVAHRPWRSEAAANLKEDVVKRIGRDQVAHVAPRVHFRTKVVCEQHR